MVAAGEADVIDKAWQALAAVGATLEDRHHAVGLGIGKRFEQDRVYCAEDRRGCANTECQDENSGGGEARIFAELAQRETKIVPCCLQSKANALDCVFLVTCTVTKIADRSVMRRFG